MTAAVVAITPNAKDRIAADRQKVFALMRELPRAEWDTWARQHVAFAKSIGYQASIFQVIEDGATLHLTHRREWCPFQVLQAYQRHIAKTRRSA